MGIRSKSQRISRNVGGSYGNQGKSERIRPKSSGIIH